MTTAQPEIKEGRQFNAIWIIPVVALVLGLYMVVHTWMTEGPEIKIAFDTAEGLTAGKTKIKYRNVEMGLVTEIELTDDYQGVIAHVKMDLQAKPLLRADTQFWVVTARIGLGQVSGLDTLLSGAYIELAPGSGDKLVREFIALERPPLTPKDSPGLRLQLTSDSATSVSTGDAVLYKGYKVGRVESTEFDASIRKVRYVIFIDAPFHDLVDSSVRFWNYSGVTLSAGADGFKVSTGSMETVLMGGVSFAHAPGIPPGEPVEPEAEFELYDDYNAILKNPFRHGAYYTVRFAQNLKGLLPGAPVEYRGIPIGRVERLMVKEMIQAQLVEKGQTDDEVDATGEAIPVLIYVEPGRMGLPDEAASVEIFHQAIVSGVRNGMRATLESGNLLTGAKYIGIDYFPDQETLEMGHWQQYSTIPAIGGGFDQILVKVNEILDKINHAPLDDTISNASAALAQLDKTLASVNTILDNQDTQALPDELRATLEELRSTLDGLSPDSALYQNISGSMLQLNRTLGNLENLTRTLQGQPNAAIMPSTLPTDPVPEARR
jgi:paraquat-inducible protein B